MGRTDQMSGCPTIPAVLIPSAMFANAAGSESGLLFMQGGGWEWFNLRSFPGTVHGVVAGIIELEAGHQPTQIEASVTGPGHDVHVFGSQLIEDPTEGNTGCRMPLIVPLTFVAREPGMYVVNITDAEGPLTSLELEVRLLVPPPEPPPGS
jgi:hypothetical protein